MCNENVYAKYVYPINIIVPKHVTYITYALYELFEKCKNISF